MEKDNFITLINEKLDKYFSPQGKKIFLALVCLAIAAAIFLGYSCMNKPEDTANLPPMEEVNLNTEEVIKDDNVEIEIEDIGKQDETLVSLSVEDFGRANPFLPSSEAFANLRGYDFELMAPPESITEDSETSKVVSTKVSGIMFDMNSPSAILNIEGSDYLVRSGDYINHYKVLSIGKDAVTVQLGANVYKARVGEVISDGEINNNEVYNLPNKFGGAKK